VTRNFFKKQIRYQTLEFNLMSGIRQPILRKKCVSKNFILLSCRIFVVPVASVAPRFTFSEKFKFMEAAGASTIALFCPAQGFPIPTIRLVNYHIFRPLFIYLSH
jgi:hypothetical protein